jgi:tetratricopeptide (TPR) repeat protein
LTASPSWLWLWLWLSLFMLCLQAAGCRKPEIQFIEDDYPRALAEARRVGKPLFIDAWAPWCHTCLSMRSYVFPDPTLRRLAGDFVWLAVDTERPGNAAFVEKYPITNWPTLWVIDPRQEIPVMKWLGSATAGELVALLEDAKQAMRTGDQGGEATAALLRGHRASARGERDRAATEYRRALSSAPAGWPRRGPAAEALCARLSELRLHGACLTVAMHELPRLPPGTAAANVGLTGLGCALKLPGGDPQREALPRLARQVLRIADDPQFRILADDRSSLYEAVIEVAGEPDAGLPKREIAARWAAFLEEKARRARDPAARAVFDAHRLVAYRALGEVERAVPMLQQSERDFPRDYNPPARLARAYLDLGRLAEARAAIERALALAYGPRRKRLEALAQEIRQASSPNGVP